MFIYLLIFNFFNLFLAAMGLHYCVRAFSSCGEQGATLHCGVRSSHCSGFSYCRAQALGMQASVVAAHEHSSYSKRTLEHVGFSSCGAWAQ